MIRPGGEEKRLTTKRHGGEGSGDQTRSPRPRIKSSHEKVGGGAETTKRPRRAPRAAAHGRPPAGASHHPSREPREPREPHERPLGLKKARGEAAPEGRDGWSVASESARTRATAIAMAALDKKAVGLEILDVAGRVDYADFLVIMTGRSDRHAIALAQGIEEALRKQGIRPIALEGLPHGSWVLMDFGDVVVHVFQDDSRRLYDLEGLWLDARRLPVPADQALAPTSND